MKFDIPIYWFPSPLSVMKEYVILSRLRCPECNGRLSRVMQEAVAKKGEEWPYPISGDILHCRCIECGHELEVEFEFREPREGEDPFADFVEIFGFCLSEFEGNPQAFAGRMHIILMDLMGHRPDLVERVLGFLADEAITTAYSGGNITPHALIALRLRDEEFMKLVDMLPPGLARLFTSLRSRFYR